MAVNYTFLGQIIYQWLAEDEALLNLLGGTAEDPRVYPSHPRVEQNLPCITYRVGPGHGDNAVPGRKETTVNVDVWSDDDESPLECETIARRVEEVMRAIKEGVYSVPGLALHGLRAEFDSGALLEEKTRTHHQALRFRAWVKYD